MPEFIAKLRNGLEAECIVLSEVGSSSLTGFKVGGFVRQQLHFGRDNLWRQDGRWREDGREHGMDIVATRPADALAGHTGKIITG